VALGRCCATKQQQERATSPAAAPASQPSQNGSPVQQQRPDLVQQEVPLSKQQQEAILPQPSAIPNMPSTDSSSLNVLENWAENYQMPDEMSLWDDGDYYSSRRDLQLAYLPPKSDLPGLAVALSLIGCWVSVVPVCRSYCLLCACCAA
jgi:hypothetical protein